MRLTNQAKGWNSNLATKDVENKFYLLNMLLNINTN